MVAALVADASVTAAWCFPDERTDFTGAVLAALTSGSTEIPVPHLWAYEVRNSVLIGVRRGRISRAHAEGFLGSLSDLPVRLAEPPSYQDIFALAVEHRLTYYDAAYLELALRQGLTLASLDNELLKAAVKVGIALFEA